MEAILVDDVGQLAEVTQHCLYNFKYGFFLFFLQKLIDSLQEAFIHDPYPPPEACDARFNMDECTLFDNF